MRTVVTDACILTGTKRFCVTCDKILRKATLLISMASPESNDAMLRLCEHAERHGCEALVSMNALDSYNEITQCLNGPIVEVCTDECSTETEAA